MTDAIVIGSGANGLTAAGYLARAGMKVLVLEKRSAVGGLASTSEFAPGFRASIGPDNCGLLLPQVIADLELEKHGLELFPLDPVVFAPSREGSGLLLHRDAGRSAEEIRKYSARDAEVYPRFAALVEKITGFLKPLFSKPAPQASIETGADLLELLRLGWGFRQLGARPMHELLRILPMSLEDFLNEWFEHPLVKAAVGAGSLEAVCLGAKSSGTSALYLYQNLSPRKLARGGSGGVTQALAKSLGARGGSIRTGAPVSRILVENGRAVGVSLSSGESIRASVILSGLAPRNTFHEIGSPTDLPASFVSEVDKIRYRGITAKLNLAVSELPDFRCRPGKDAALHHRALIQIGESLDDYERAYDAAKYGRFSERPLLTVVIPSLIDRGLAPEGKHVLSIIAQFAPYRLREGSWSSSKDALSSAILDRLSEYAPNVKKTVLHQRLWSPEDYERGLGLPEGNWHQGEMALDQMFFMRPVPEWSRYQTPIDGLYLAGASTHPGGAITGACGYNAAQKILKRRSS
ncbi:MAG TPA: NAD(P)/FAD-dependent oxidoreductase [Vicinamibacteria bacterium]